MLLPVLVALASTQLSICNNNYTSFANMREKLVTETLLDAKLRTSLALELQQGLGAKCRDMLTQYMQDIISGKQNDLFEKGRLAFILLAIQGHIVGTAEVLQKEIVAGRGDELLEELRKLDGKIYIQTLSDWTKSVADEIRREQNLADPRDFTRITSPLILEKFLQSIKISKLTLLPAQMSDLNVIYAASTAPYRNVFLPLLKDIFSRQLNSWILELRNETSWVQIRLFSVMTAIGGGTVVRELLWMSTHHHDEKIRAFATQSLDSLLMGPQKKP